MTHTDEHTHTCTHTHMNTHEHTHTHTHTHLACMHTCTCLCANIGASAWTFFFTYWFSERFKRPFRYHPHGYDWDRVRHSRMLCWWQKTILARRFDALRHHQLANWPTDDDAERRNILPKSSFVINKASSSVLLGLIYWFVMYWDKNVCLCICVRACSRLWHRKRSRNTWRSFTTASRCLSIRARFFWLECSLLFVICRAKDLKVSFCSLIFAWAMTQNSWHLLLHHVLCLFLWVFITLGCFFLMHCNPLLFRCRFNFGNFGTSIFYLNLIST